jgi:hypothetical protein
MTLEPSCGTSGTAVAVMLLKACTNNCSIDAGFCELAFLNFAKLGRLICTVGNVRGGRYDSLSRVAADIKCRPAGRAKSYLLSLTLNSYALQMLVVRVAIMLQVLCVYRAILPQRIRAKKKRF